MIPHEMLLVTLQGDLSVAKIVHIPPTSRKIRGSWPYSTLRDVLEEWEPFSSRTNKDNVTTIYFVRQCLPEANHFVGNLV